MSIASTVCLHAALLLMVSNPMTAGLQLQTRAPNESERAISPHEFDFLLGDWKVHNRLLKTRLAKSTDWIEFEAFDSFHALPRGTGYRRKLSHGALARIRRIGLHLFDPAARQWTLYWADSRNSPGTMQTLAKGDFSKDTGIFFGEDTFNGKPVSVRIIWKRIDSNHAHWEQALSLDNRLTWETNWTMDFTRN